MFRILEQALKSILFNWKTNETYKYGYKPNWLEKCTSWGSDIACSYQFMFRSWLKFFWFTLQWSCVILLCDVWMWTLFIANATCQNIQPLKELILGQVPIYQLEVVQESKSLLLVLQLEPRNSLCNVAKLFNNSLSAKFCSNCRCSTSGMGREPTGSCSLGAERICMEGGECHIRTGVLPCWGEGSSGLLNLN